MINEICKKCNNRIKIRDNTRMYVTKKGRKSIKIYDIWKENGSKNSWLNPIIVTIVKLLLKK